MGRLSMIVVLLLASAGADAAPKRPLTAEQRQELQQKLRAHRRVGPMRKDKVDWKSAERRFRLDRAALSEQAREQVDRSSVPVLLPRKPDLLENAIVLVGDGWYTATMDNEAYHVFVRGTRVARAAKWKSKDKRHLARRKRKKLDVQRIDGLVTISFSVHGVAYNLEVECKRGPTDRFCAKDDTVTELHGVLGLAGGLNRDMR